MNGEEEDSGVRGVWAPPEPVDPRVEPSTEEPSNPDSGPVKVDN